MTERLNWTERGCDAWGQLLQQPLVPRAIHLRWLCTDEYSCQVVPAGTSGSQVILASFSGSDGLWRKLTLRRLRKVVLGVGHRRRFAVVGLSLRHSAPVLHVITARFFRVPQWRSEYMCVLWGPNLTYQDSSGLCYRLCVLASCLAGVLSCPWQRPVMTWKAYSTLTLPTALFSGQYRLGVNSRAWEATHTHAHRHRALLR